MRLEGYRGQWFKSPEPFRGLWIFPEGWTDSDLHFKSDHSVGCMGTICLVLGWDFFDYHEIYIIALTEKLCCLKMGAKGWGWGQRKTVLKGSRICYPDICHFGLRIVLRGSN